LLFDEKFAAAQSLKNRWTRLASTYGCIHISLDSEKLIIKPHWFARWIIALLNLDLSYEIPISQIKNIANLGSSFGFVQLKISFVQNERAGDLFLFLKKADEFLKLFPDSVSRSLTVAE